MNVCLLIRVDYSSLFIINLYVKGINTWITELRKPRIKSLSELMTKHPSTTVTWHTELPRRDTGEPCVENWLSPSVHAALKLKDLYCKILKYIERKKIVHVLSHTHYKYIPSWHFLIWRKIWKPVPKFTEFCKYDCFWLCNHQPKHPLLPVMKRDHLETQPLLILVPHGYCVISKRPLSCFNCKH